MEHQWNIPLLLQVTILVFYCPGCSAVSASLCVLVGSDVTLQCLSAKLPQLQDLSSLTVEWSRENRHFSRRQTVYTFEDGRAQVSRAGAEVDRVGLLQSDASLTLHNVTVGDEGVYSCRIITPVVDTLSTTLEVLARPSVLLPEKASVAEGEEKLIQCDIGGYYPSTLTVSWLLQNGSHLLQAGPLYRVCTEMSVLHTDGTYSIRSGITVHSSALKDGALQLLCRVEHQTYLSPYNTSVTLTLQAPSEPYGAFTLVAVTSFLVMFAVGGTLLLMYFRRKAEWLVSLCVSEISQPSVTYAHVESVLRCLISGVRRGELQVKWFKLSADLVVQSEEDPLLHWEDVSEWASLESGGSHHTAVLSVCLSIREDRSRYRCEVHWRDQRVTRETTVRVRVEPSFLQISSIPQIPKVQRLLVLCCRVENFYPPDVHLEWSRNDGELVHPTTHFGPFSDHNHLYSMWSKIQLTMATEDESTVYTCRVYHSSFMAPGYRDALYHINTQGMPPNVMFIDCEPLCPVPNTECTLHLCIRDFCPKHVTVTWTLDGEPVDSGSVFNTPPSLNINGLYSMYSFLKLTPSQDEWTCCYRCQVEHSAQSQPEEREFTLGQSPDSWTL